MKNYDNVLYSLTKYGRHRLNILGQLVRQLKIFKENKLQFYVKFRTKIYNTQGCEFCSMIISSNIFRFNYNMFFNEHE